MTKNSAEIKYYKFWFIFSIVINAIILLPSLALIASEDFREEAIVYIVLMAMFLLPMIFYYGYRLIYYKRLKPLYIQEVKLEKVESAWTRYARFSFVMEIGGSKRTVNTLAVFTVGYFGPNIIDEYSSKLALVGYDEKNDVAVVLKVLE